MPKHTPVIPPKHRETYQHLHNEAKMKAKGGNTSQISQHHIAPPKNTFNRSQRGR